MMFVILSYDVGEKRVAGAEKIARKYLKSVQRSLYHGYLTEKQISGLKNELAAYLDAEHDAVIVYKMYNGDVVGIDEIGVRKALDSTII